jgi:hypothetical protein
MHRSNAAAALWRWPAALAGLSTAVLLAATAPELGAQSPTAASVRVSGWVPADGVAPRITITTAQDRTTGIWTYIYRVMNAGGATQRLGSLALLTPASIASATAPKGWWALVVAAPATRPGATFGADLADEGNRPAALSPGGGPLTFTLTSPAAPGPIRYFARGDVQSPALDDLPLEQQLRIPSDEKDAIRGSIQGPAQ